MTAAVPMSATAANAPWEGAGTADNPFKISSEADLVSVSDAVYAEYLSAHFEQTADIDLTGINWIPIGDAGTPFTGTYDGNGKTIANLTIDDGTLEYVGLFGLLGDGGRLENITLTGVSVTSTRDAVWTKVDRDWTYVGSACVGGLVGAIDNGTVTGCSSAGSVTAGTAARVGGLVGYNAINIDDSVGGTVSNCSSSGTVTGGMMRQWADWSA